MSWIGFPAGVLVSVGTIILSIAYYVKQRIMIILGKKRKSHLKSMKIG